MAELDTLINYWKNTLFHQGYLMETTTQYLVAETIRQLDCFKTLYPDGRHAPDLPKPGGD